MNRQLRQKAVFFLSAVMLVFAPLARSQDQSSTAPQSGSNSAQTKPKVKAQTKPQTEEAEAGSAAATDN